MKFDENDCPLLIVLGQSNAVGHGTSLSKERQIHTPLTHVFGLAREKNQAFGLSSVEWSGYTSKNMNLGEAKDDTACLATEFARKWQHEIDVGRDLPDLYVVNISVGAQGVHEHEIYEDTDLNMWSPRREPILISGEDEPINISLYPLAIEILSLAVKSIKEMGKKPVVVGLHWNQWETEVLVGGDSLKYAERNYTELFLGFRNALGLDYPLYLYKPLSEFYNEPERVDFITALFEKYADGSPLVKILDLSKSKLWKQSDKTFGIFSEDCVHYNSKAHEWFAEQQLEPLLD